MQINIEGADFMVVVVDADDEIHEPNTQHPATITTIHHLAKAVLSSSGNQVKLTYAAQGGMWSIVLREV